MQLMFESRRRRWESSGTDPDILQLAIYELTQSFESEKDPFQKAEAAFFLAKAELQRGHVHEARSWFAAVLDQRVEDYRAESMRILKALK